jgi:hypothetical protein
MALDPEAMGMAGTALGTAIGGPIGGGIGGIAGGLASDLWNTYVNPTPPAMPAFEFPDTTIGLQMILQSSMANYNSLLSYLNAQNKTFNFGPEVRNAANEALDEAYKIRREIVNKHGAKARARKAKENKLYGNSVAGRNPTPAEIMELRDFGLEYTSKVNSHGRLIRLYGKSLREQLEIHGGIQRLQRILETQPDRLKAVAPLGFDFGSLFRTIVQAAPKVITTVKKGLGIAENFLNMFNS